jgi:hypothetical protein
MDAKYFMNDYDNVLLHFHEIKDLVLGINDFFKALSFEVEDRYQKGDYYNVDVRQVIVYSFDDIIDQSMLPLIMNSDYVSKEYNWDINLNNLNLDNLKDKEKMLLESFKKKASGIRLI